MVTDDLSIGGEPDIGLDQVRAVLHREVEGGEAVLGGEVRGATVRHHPGPRTGQAEPLGAHAWSCL